MTTSAEHRLRIFNVKAAVRERDGHRCTKCGMTNLEHQAKYHGKSLDVHRVVLGSPYELSACVTLCKVCHGYEPRCPRRKQPTRNLTTRLQLNLSPEIVERIGRQRKRFGLSFGDYLRYSVALRLNADEATDRSLRAAD